MAVNEVEQLRKNLKENGYSEKATYEISKWYE